MAWRHTEVVPDDGVGQFVNENGHRQPDDEQEADRHAGGGAAEEIALAPQDNQNDERYVDKDWQATNTADLELRTHASGSLPFSLATALAFI